MSKYVNQMRDALASFNRKTLEIGEEMAKNKKRYFAGIALEKNEPLRMQLKQATVDTRDQIDGILQEAETAARKWAALDGKEINAADLSLLKGDFALSVKSINDLVARYWNNGTMINAIDKYVKQHRIACYVPCLDDKLQAYRILAKSAHSLIASISENIGIDEDRFADWGKSGNVSDRLQRALYGA